MNYFHMTYDEVLNSPWQRLVCLANSIPKYSEKEEKKETENKKGILDFVRNNNLVKK